MSIAELLAQPHLSVITRSADPELVRIQDMIEHKVLIDGRADLEAMFGKLLACNTTHAPKTLDLIGHSTEGKSLLMLGDWVIDAANPTVASYFRELADQDVLPRLAIHAVRLLGCLTADTGHARSTISALAKILEVEVFGTTDLIFSAHYDANGFRHDRRHLLASSSDVRNERELARDRHAYPCLLDIDALPAMPLFATEQSWPVRVANRDDARSLLRLVRRREGAPMPGLLTSPRCEVALPSGQSGHYHRAQILLDGEFVRVYPDVTQPGIVFPVDNAHLLRTLVDQLPAVWTSPSIVTRHSAPQD